MMQYRKTQVPTFGFSEEFCLLSRGRISPCSLTADFNGMRPSKMQGVLPETVADFIHRQIESPDFLGLDGIIEEGILNGGVLRNRVR
jgi:hypothetical protein